MFRAEHYENALVKGPAVLPRSLLLMVVSASMMGATHVCPPDCHDEKDPVKATIIVILAREDGSTVDPRLKAIAQEVQKIYPNLKSFELKHMTSKSFKPGEKVSLPLVEKQKMTFVIKHGANAENRVGLAVTAPGLDEIEYQTVCGKFLPIVTPWHSKAKERLILAIRVQPCRGD